MNFGTFVEFVSEIMRSNSRNHKVATLHKYKDSEDVKFCLEFVFNPYVTTGLNKKKLAKPVAPDIEFGGDVGALLNWIRENNTGRDEAVAKVNGVKLMMPTEWQNLLDRVICKNMPIGVETGTINKEMPGLIPVFSVMLANKYFDNPEVLEGKKFTVTTKIDGGRIIALKQNGEIKFFTRAGQEYEGLVDLEEEMLDKLPDNYMLDGEIMLADRNGLDNKAQYKQTMMVTRRDGEKHGVKMLVFDGMPVHHFILRKKWFTYGERREALRRIFEGSHLKFFELLPVLYNGTDTTMVTRLLEEQIAKGEEGVMVNIDDEPYSFDRTNALLKVKKMKDLDLTVIRLEEGSNQNTGKLGAFVVDYKGNEVRVGSGISKAVREKVWKEKEEYIGRTIIVQYFEETKNQSGGVSLRFPVFVDFRYDK